MVRKDDNFPSLIVPYKPPIKERAATHTPCHTRYTGSSLQGHFFKCIIHSRNSFPHKGSISKIIVSNTILLVNPSPDFNIKWVFFGSYDMVYTGTTNTFNRRSVPGIALR